MAAQSFPTLATTRYVKPGSYIGQLIRPDEASLSGTPFIPAYIGRGSRLAEAKNQSITRGYIVGTDNSNRGALTFSEVSPHIAELPYLANGDQQVARIYTTDHKVVSPSAWFFRKSDNSLSGYDQVVISDRAFDGTKSYLIDYQSVERSVEDIIPFEEIREVVHLSLQTDQDEYVEYVDFWLPSTFTAIERDRSSHDIDEDGKYNENVSSSIGTLTKTAGTADLLALYNSSFTHKYNRTYTLTLETGGTNLADLKALVLELGNDYTAHIAEGSTVHTGADVTNALSGPVLTLLGAGTSGWTISNIITIVSDIATKYNAHRQLTGLTGHTAVDNYNVFGPSISVTTLGEAYRFACILRLLFETGLGSGSVGHFNQLVNQSSAAVHGAVSTQTVTSPAATFKFKYSAKPTGPGWVNNDTASENMPEPIIDETFSVAMATPNVADANGVGASSVHQTLETASGIQVALNFAVAKVDVFAAGDTWVLNSSGPGLIELDERYANQNQFVYVSDVIHEQVLDVANDLRASYEAHRQRSNISSSYVHDSGSFVDTVNAVEKPVATDEATCVALLNDIKAKYNAHEVYTTNAIHGNNTAVNPVTADDATDWATAIVLANDLITELTDHYADTAGSKHGVADSVTTVPSALAEGTFSKAFVDTEYTGSRNRRYMVEVTAYSGGTTSVQWKAWGEVSGTDGYLNSGTADLADGDTLALDSGVLLDLALNGGTFTVGDKFSLLVLAPRTYYKGHDARTYRLQVTEAAGSPTYGATLQWFTTTPEGGFGVNEVATLYPASLDPYILLPDNVELSVRNLAPTNRHSSSRTSDSQGDLHEFTVTPNRTIDFSLKKRIVQTISKADFRSDAVGTITGIPGRYYAVLSAIPLNDDGTAYGEFGIKSVKNASDDDVVATHIDGTAYIYVSKTVYNAMAATGVTVTFFGRGNEPDPAQAYYLSALYLRPDEFYETPLLLVGSDQASVTLNPMGSENHLAIMAQAAFKAPGLQAIMAIQVRDLDDDGVFTDEDFERAIDAAKEKDTISDVIVLSNWGSLSDTLNHLNQCNDPFARKPRLGWFGAPVGTPIGDADTADSLIYTAKKTLQVYGNNQAHGSRILSAPRYVKGTITLPNGTTQEVTLDGSFLAGSLAAVADGFSDASETILRKQIPGWDEIEVFTNSQDLLFGDAAIIYIEDIGSGVYRAGESFTVDKLAPNFSEISAMKQKHKVERIVREDLDNAFVSYVPPSVPAAISQLRGRLVSILTTLISRGQISPYLDDTEENVRQINPQTDIVVARDRATKTLYNFLFSFYIKYPIKRLFGLYSVDSNKLPISNA